MALGIGKKKDLWDLMAYNGKSTLRSLLFIHHDGMQWYVGRKCDYIYLSIYIYIIIQAYNGIAECNYKCAQHLNFVNNRKSTMGY